MLIELLLVLWFELIISMAALAVVFIEDSKPSLLIYPYRILVYLVE